MFTSVGLFKRISMFVKVSKSKNYTYVQIVKSVREEGKIKHKVIGTLGRLDILLKNNQLENIAKKLYELATEKKPGDFQIREIRRLKYGDIVYRKIWEQLQLDKIIGKLSSKHKYEFDLEKSIFYLVVNRLLNPSSKLKAYRMQDNFLHHRPIKLHQFYRSLDFLSKDKKLIENELYQIRKDLFNMNLDLVFYDLTTFHFESVKYDALRDFGFSKNNKVNEVQVILGLLVDRDKRPIGYELFKGNTSEKRTLDSIVSVLKQKFGLQDIIMVSDNGLFSIENISKVLAKGYNLIIRYSVRKHSKRLGQWVNSGSFQEQRDARGEVMYRYKVLEEELKGKRGIKVSGKLILIYSEKLARMHRSKRERLLEKARKLLEDGNLQKTNTRGAYKYLKFKRNVSSADVDIDESVELDLEKVSKEQELDGYLGIFVSGAKAEKLSAKEVLSQYKLLWQIEESFRLLKTTMRTRPVYHWSAERIKGHFMLCFLSFVLERELELILKQENLALSSEQIKSALNSLEVSEIEVDGKLYYLKGRNSREASKILKVLKIPPMKNLVPKL